MTTETDVRPGAREAELAARVERLELELTEAKAALAAKPIVDRAQLFALTDAMPVLVSVIGRDQRYEFANKAYETWFGTDDGPVAGRHARDVLGYEAYDRLLPQFERALAGERVAFEAEIPYKSGGTRHVFNNLAPRRAPDGEITGVVALVVDLSGRFVDDTALRASEARLSAVLESVSDGFYALDADWRFTLFNAAAERYFGRSRDDVLGRRFGEVFPEALDTEFEARFARLMAGGPAERFEIESRAVPGRVVEMRVAPKAVGGLVVSFTDITDRRHAEAGLHEARARAEAEAAERAAILEQLAEGVITTDAEGGITFVNEAAARIHGMSRLHVGAPDYAQTYGLYTEDGEPHPSLDLPLARAVRGETVTEARWLIRRPDAEVLAIGNAKPVLAPDGAQIGAVLTLRDESAREMAETALRDSEERYRTLFEAIESGFCIAEVDLAGPGGRVDYRVVEANPAFYEQTGFPQAILGQWLRQAAPELEEHWYETYGRVARTGEAARFEQGSNHLGRWFDVYAFPTGAPGGRRVAILFNDISARRNAEQAVRASEERLRLATEGAGMGTWDYDFASGQGLWSDSAFAILGHAPTPDRTWTFDMWRDAVHPDDLARVRAAAADAKAGGDAYSVEYRIIRADDGGERWVQAFGHYVYGEDGEAARYVGVFFDITDRKQAEQHLRESESRLERALDAGELGAWELDLATLAAWRSHQHDRVFGYGTMLPEWTYGMFLDHVVPEDRNWVDAAFQAAIASGGRWDFECRIRRADGVLRWIWAQGRVDVGAGGQPGRMKGTVRDVTARREAEAAIRDSEARFRLIADAAPVPMWVTRLDRKREFVNRAYIDFLGVSYDEAVDFDWRAVIHPDDAPRIYKEQVEKEASLQPFTLEARYRDAKGGWRWLRSESQPRWGANGEHAGFIGVAYDVTIAKEAELALEAQVAARSAERDRLWNLSQDMLARADYSGMMSAVSPAWTQVLGWSETELLTRGYATFMHPEDMPPTLEAIQRMAETRRPARFENRIATLDGGFKHIEWTVAPEPDGVNFIAVGRDLSHAKAREAELEAAQEALRQSQKMEAVGQLTGGVAHDFNNLLTPIMGSLDMLRRRMTADERAQRTIDLALQATSRAATLVQRLLAFARRQDLQARSVDVADLLGGIEELVARSLGSGIRVEIDAPAGLPPAHVDANQLELAILNLSINARDAMPGGGTLAIAAREAELTRAEADLKPGRYVRVSVADTGIGMDADTLRRAIEPFFSTKGVGKGTGLGLSMAHGLAAQLGGALRLSSTPGVGTTAELWLPVAAKPAEADASLAPPPTKAQRAATILLVDDEDLVRAGTADMLADLGYRVVEAASGPEALAKLADGAKPDLLVTDYLMPDMNGLDLAATVRRDHPSLPILMISGYTNLEAGGGDLPRLLKPFRQEELAAKVAALLKPLSP